MTTTHFAAILVGCMAIGYLLIRSAYQKGYDDGHRDAMKFANEQFDRMEWECNKEP